MADVNPAILVDRLDTGWTAVERVAVALRTVRSLKQELAAHTTQLGKIQAAQADVYRRLVVASGEVATAHAAMLTAMGLVEAPAVPDDPPVPTPKETTP